MMISTLVESSPGGSAGRTDAAGTQDPTRFSEFSLTPAPHLLQTSLIHENPFCRLVQRTSDSRAACNKGCGLGDPVGESGHTCPFGLRMIRAKAPVDTQGATRWIGRRFPSVDAMHNALDELLRLGQDEETILAHLPPNPIATDEEFFAAIDDEPIPGVTPAVKTGTVADAHDTALAAASSGEAQVLNVLEYVEQIQALLATARQPAAVCERFLRVLAGMVPFEEMSIYLQDPATGELVIAASVDQQSSRNHPLAHDCRLMPESVGGQALAQRRMLIEHEGVIEPVGGRMPEGGTLAIPLPLRPGQGLGVWLAGREKDQYPSRLGSDPVRVMRLLVSILTMRLQQMTPEPGRQIAPDVEGDGDSSTDVAPQWDREALMGVLESEIARAAVTDTRLALLRLHIACRNDMVSIPTREIEEALRGILRPFDQISMDPSRRDAWAIVIPLADERLVARVSARLIEVIEDHLDACGGKEEQGLWPAVGVSIYGLDATDGAQLIEHAGVALRLASQAHLEEPIRTYADSLDQSDPIERADHA